ncbi:hypothetical protein GCM10009551_053810 [Nocardiopsis tropica]|uniref:hypothetical protein n=1 Tax=Tsukamurella strandjordii TaxID=147577 RepID=UPI0031E3A11C
MAVAVGGLIQDRWWERPIETERDLIGLPVDVHARDAYGVECRTVGRGVWVRLDTDEDHVLALPAVFI